MINTEMNTVLKNTNDMLERASFALNDFKKEKNPKKRMAHLVNFINNSRSVTFALQKIENKVVGFKDWYKKYQDQMKADPLMKFFKDLRDDIVHEGKLDVSGSMHIKQLSFPKDLTLLGKQPQNATGYFFGDNIGGNGWEIQMPDGSIKKQYVDIETDNISFTSTFQNAPIVHLNNQITDNSIENLCDLYIKYLDNLIESAKTQLIMGTHAPLAN